ncbi:RDD family protein [Thiolinea disciformis]|uniref:RDD family protein n=1 Tax=Thiolinea disciformis TaxID=125614 RepID=UPI0003786F60|nr:RDD family protein [Thiolinea disciformis]
MRIDTTYTVQTPEGIELKLSPAGPVPRMWAWVIDLGIRVVIYFLTFALASFLGETGLGIAFILMFLMEWFYPVWFELRSHGQTPGKKYMGLYVAHLDASPISPAASVVRNLLRVVDFLPLFYGLGLISILLNRRFQRLGDLAANTVVLYKPEVSKPLQANQAPAMMPPVSLTLAEQQAIILFAQREKSLTPERQEELADLTGTLVAGQLHKAAWLRSIASWITGQ